MGWVLQGYLGTFIGILAAILSTHGIRTGYITWVLWRGQKTPWELIAVASLVLAYAISGGYLLPPPESATQVTKVTRIIDGDTIKIGHRKIRLADIDAPELSQPWGELAKECLAKIIHGRWIVLEEKGTDLYGRALATLYLPQDEQRININQLMVRKGCAWAYGKAYKTDEARARALKTGLWKQKHPVKPSKWRRMQ